MKGVVLGGTSSGVGKTVAALSVLRALENAGHEPVPAKAGPDFIDPSHHAAVFEKPSRTLDTWMQGLDGVRRTAADAASDGDFMVVEGMMGLYDGSVTSTAATAAALDLPVVLVVDAQAGMQSVGATALGFREYAAHDALPDDVRETIEDPRVDVAGIVAQRAHGGRHEEGIRDALPEGIQFLGRIPPTSGLEIPDRHLGLHMGDEAPLGDEAIDSGAEHVDVAALLDVAREPAQPSSRIDQPSTATIDDRPTVAVAQDEAFRFIYPSTRERLGTLADVVTFAPVAGDDLPTCDAVYLPGGYPELNAEALSASPALSTLTDRAAEGLPILGECGGFMALAESLTTDEGDTYEMAGVLPGGVEMHGRYQALDHVELVAREDGPTSAAGAHQRGHEFHYSSHDSAAVDAASDARFAFDVERGDGIDGDHDGLREYATVGTYAHRHAASGAFDRLVEAARER
ncbi:MAG: cobyrinate a,c-diamide synthase [Halopenitus sp.]